MSFAVTMTILFILALFAWYLSFSASRLDRLHHRVEGARNALDAQLVRRAETAIELATSGAVDPASGLLLADAASRAIEAGEGSEPRSAALAGPRAGEALNQEQAESDLSQALRASLDAGLVTQLSDDRVFVSLIDRLAAACLRVQLARRFHNAAVTDAVRVRRKRIVRWFRLAGRASEPRTFEVDDDPPPALERGATSSSEA